MIVSRSLRTLFKNTFSFTKTNNFNIFNKVNQRCFSNDDTHPDFQTKSKVVINNENVNELIEDWIKNNDVVLFMKGTREMPRCGFSNYAVQILNFYGIKKVKTVNILEDSILREAVKNYSNWPTYPQLYIKGNLIGGCDIMREMHENGTFKELVEREGITENKI